MVSRVGGIAAFLSLVGVAPVARAVTRAEFLDGCTARLSSAANRLSGPEKVACFQSARATYATSGELDNFVQVVAQVVVDKAKEAGWKQVESRLIDGARCPDEDHPNRTPLFPATCRVLTTADIHDILAQPDLLLSAAGEDLLFYLQAEIAKQPVLKPYADAIAQGLLLSSTDAFASLLQDWRLGGVKNVTDRLARDFLKRVEKQMTTSPQCPSDSVGASLYVVGMCAIQQQDLASINKCDYEKFLSDCTSLVNPDRVRSMIVLAFTAFAGKGSARIEAQIGLPFAVLDAEIQEGKIAVPDKQKAHDMLMAEQDVIQGLVSADYVRATSGAITIVEEMVRASCPDPKTCGDPVTDERADRRKVLAVLAAAGKYAATLKSTGSTEDIQAQRAEIIKELVERTVSRTGREHGVIVSLGGNLGLLGGKRVTPAGDAQWAFPVQLGLGLGLQTYHSKTVGFHAMLTALELGQYVVFNAGDLKVQTPDAASSVIIGATLGVWGIARETPFYFGPYGAVSPFVKTIDGAKATYQIGLAAGIYVPLFDFN